ncbi:MAG TPA: endonuclease III [Candidatus Limnocylindria bacterium]|nr:endonuclease III [Candidatus Limnocylindria bacterium]
MPARAPFGFDAPAKALGNAAPASAKARIRGAESAQEKAERAAAIAAGLAGLYGAVECPLTHRNNFELLVAVILSAQCTDAAVNKVTPELFARYPNPLALSQASLADIESVIRTLGLFRAKAKSLKRCAEQLVLNHHGEVPSAMADLIELAGVGRKTANVIRGHAFGEPGIAVDTHCRRLARRLRLTRQQNPVKIEIDLARLLPSSEWTNFSHRLIIHGRRVCFARKPACDRCSLRRLCPSAQSQPG